MWDVVIVGGGPAGSTAGTLLKKYNPDLRVLIVEKEKFPRDHIGESQLPAISFVLDEMGAWDKVEAAGFPIKVGASYTWGAKADRWDFDFYPVEFWENQPRPGRFEGQRRYSAFQVDRSIYDEILLRHARDEGVVVRQETRVARVLTTNGRVDGLVLDSGETVTASYYVDASGVVALLRRALGIEIEAPFELRNIAIWDYWQNADWAVEIGVGGTRIQVRSLPWGWIWFIPLGPTRTSVGLVCPATYYKKTGKTPDDLYLEALQSQPDIWRLMTNATRRGVINTCKDWSHLADRVIGENWFICGDAAGFADPILSAGMSLAHSAARDVAYTILELMRGELDSAWLRHRYQDRTRESIRQHIRFAQFWYSANGRFTDLKDHCRAIAKEAGLPLSPAEAWRWLSQGGFTNESVSLPLVGAFDIASAKQLLELFDGRREVGWLANGYSTFKLDLIGATKGHVGFLENGRIRQVPAYFRGTRKLVLAGYFGSMVEILQRHSDATAIFRAISNIVQQNADSKAHRLILGRFGQTLDGMIQEGWVTRKKDPRRPAMVLSNDGAQLIRTSAETEKAIQDAGRSNGIKSRI
jgi:flavin-dependent dehydrogenase